jgi:hypothetical protein
VFSCAREYKDIAVPQEYTASDFAMWSDVERMRPWSAGDVKGRVESVLSVVYAYEQLSERITDPEAERPFLAMLDRFVRAYDKYSSWSSLETIQVCPTSAGRVYLA